MFLAQRQALIRGRAVEGALGIEDGVDPAHGFERQRRLGDVRQHDELAPCVAPARRLSDRPRLAARFVQLVEPGVGDFGYVVAFARAPRAAGARNFMLVSAIGASVRSAVVYLCVKGETEEAVAALGYPALHIFRPGLLLGRRSESRPREALGMALAPLLNPLMLGPAKAYRGLPGDTVAAAMIAAAGTERTGRHIHTCADMMAPEGIKR